MEKSYFFWRSGVIPTLPETLCRTHEFPISPGQRKSGTNPENPVNTGAQIDHAREKGPCHCHCNTESGRNQDLRDSFSVYGASRTIRSTPAPASRSFVSCCRRFQADRKTDTAGARQGAETGRPFEIFHKSALLFLCFLPVDNNNDSWYNYSRILCVSAGIRLRQRKEPPEP